MSTRRPLPRPPTAVVRAVYATSRQNPGLFHREAKRASIAERRVLVQFWGLAELRRCLAYPCRRPPSSPAFAPSPTKSRPDTPETKIGLLWYRGGSVRLGTPAHRRAHLPGRHTRPSFPQPTASARAALRSSLCAAVHADAHTRPVELTFGCGSCLAADAATGGRRHPPHPRNQTDRNGEWCRHAGAVALL